MRTRPLEIAALEVFVVILVLVVAVSCSSSNDTTHTMHLTVTSALSGSQQLVVEDGNGTTVAAETVTLPQDCLMNGCTTVIDVPDVPDEDFYKVILGSGIPRSATLERSALEANNWSAAVQL